MWQSVAVGGVDVYQRATLDLRQTTWGAYVYESRWDWVVRIRQTAGGTQRQTCRACSWLTENQAGRIAHKSLMPLASSDALFIAVCRTLLANGFRSYRCHCHCHRCCCYCCHCCSLCALKGCERRQAACFQFTSTSLIKRPSVLLLLLPLLWLTHREWMLTGPGQDQGQNQDLSQCQCLRDALGRSAVCLCFARGFGARDFHTNVIKSSTTLKLNTSHGANGVMIFYVELDADNGTIAALTPLPTSPFPPDHPLSPSASASAATLPACFPAFLAVSAVWAVLFLFAWW